MAFSMNSYYFSFLFSVVILNSYANAINDDSTSLPLSDTHFSNKASELKNLLYDYYRLTCPNAESTIFQIMRDVVAIDNKATAQLLRLMFHDCFIQVHLFLHFPFIFTFLMSNFLLIASMCSMIKVSICLSC